MVRHPTGVRDLTEGSVILGVGELCGTERTVAPALTFDYSGSLCSTRETGLPFDWFQRRLNWTCCAARILCFKLGGVMSAEIWDWLLTALTASGFTGVILYLMRKSLSRYFLKAIEHKFEKQLETFKAEIRDNEKELDQIRSFLVSAQRNRDSALQVKRLDAAETLLRARHSYSQLSILVEYVKLLNIEEIQKNRNDPKIVEFIDTLLKPVQIEEKLKLFASIDQTLPRLYLGERTLKLYDTYTEIIIHACLMMKLISASIPVDGGLLKTGDLSQKVIDLVPSSKDGFGRWGDTYAFYWSSYLHDQVLRSLRQEISGTDDVVRDKEAIERLAIDSRQALASIRSAQAKAGLPDGFIKPLDSASEGSVSEKDTAE